MAIGTAGYTAALAVLRMEDMGQHPQMGPILVTGATGGVGCLAIDMLSGLGYEVAALSGKPEQEAFLSRLGAERFVDRHSLEMGTHPLERALWGGAVDSVGGPTLDWLTRTVSPWGNIASIGLVGGIELHTTVMPFILRGVSLLGINSVLMPLEVRDRAWQRLGTDLKPRHLDEIVTRTIDFNELPSAFDDYLAGRVTGRTVVRIGT
jgi:NADPH2:quinone reductase